MGKSTLIGGGVGAAAGGLTYAAKTIWNNTRGSWVSEFNEDGEMLDYAGKRSMTDAESSMRDKFTNYRNEGIAENKAYAKGESVASYKVKRNLLGKTWVEQVEGGHFETTNPKFKFLQPSKADFFIHSHPHKTVPNVLDGLNYLKYPRGAFYMMQDQTRNLFQFWDKTYMYCY